MTRALLARGGAPFSSWISDVADVGPHLAAEDLPPP